MFKPFVHLSLIAVLLGCPPSCFVHSIFAAGREANGRGAIDAVQGGSGGCCCCHKAGGVRKAAKHARGDDATTTPDSPTPCNNDRPSGGPCQCICGGAVVDDHVAFDAAEATHAIDVLAFSPPMCCPTPAEAEFSDGRLLERQMVLSGRDLCRLRALMLC